MTALRLKLFEVLSIMNLIVIHKPLTRMGDKCYNYDFFVIDSKIKDYFLYF